MLEKSETEQLDKAWTITRIIWGSLFGSLVVYLLVCKFIEDQLKPVVIGFPFETMKNVLLGVSVLTFFVIYYVRKTMLKVSVRSSANVFVRDQSSQIKNPAAGKYVTAIIVAMALSESIGISGLVLFFLSRDSMVLYQFITMSALAMYYYRPRKEELLQIAEEMKKQAGTRIVP